MREYFFFFNDDNEFKCVISSDDEQIELFDNDAIDELIKIDKMSFSKLRASNRMIKLTNKDCSVIISDLKDFYSYQYSSFIPNIMKRVNKAISKNQKAKHNNNKVSNLKVAGGRIACGALILTILGTTAGALHKHRTDNDFNNSFNYESDFNEGPIDLEAIAETINEDEFNQMIDELEETSKYFAPPQDNNGVLEDNPISTAYLRYDDLTSSNTYIDAFEDYYSIVEKYSNKWGISPNIIMAMLTQESAGKQINLMQIQFDSWIDQVLTAYDFVNGRYQKIVLTDTPSRYAGQNITVITREDLQNKVTNISVACVILRYCLERMDYNIIVSIQAYNLGCDNMNIVLEETSRQTGKSVDELLADQTNTEFTNYTYIVECGDPKYVTNVSRYLTEGEITIERLNEEGETESLVIRIAQKQL